MFSKGLTHLGSLSWDGGKGFYNPEKVSTKGNRHLKCLTGGMCIKSTADFDGERALWAGEWGRWGILRALWGEV